MLPQPPFWTTPYDYALQSCTYNVQELPARQGKCRFQQHRQHLLQSISSNHNAAYFIYATGKLAAQPWAMEQTDGCSCRIPSGVPWSNLVAPVSAQIWTGVGKWVRHPKRGHWCVAPKGGSAIHKSNGWCIDVQVKGRRIGVKVKG